MWWTYLALTRNTATFVFQGTDSGLNTDCEDYATSLHSSGSVLKASFQDVAYQGSGAGALGVALTLTTPRRTHPAIWRPISPPQ